MCDIGIIGMAVMGQNLALNIAKKGYSVAVFNRTPSKTHDVMKRRAAHEALSATYNMEEFISLLQRPRRIMLMVKAGQPVDDIIQTLTPYLEKGDLVIDGGNSYFKDTERRYRDAESHGLLFLGTGISGGEYGALHGPSIMPGGHRAGYDLVKDIFEKISAQVDDGPCCTFLGSGAAGHFVKMVHNGIEYAFMQSIAECYDLMRKIYGLPAPEIADIFDDWNATDELNSFLLEITATVLRKRDPETGNFLVDMILDEAEQKGTGKWTSQAAYDFGVPTPVVNQSVIARTFSSFKETRNRLSLQFGDPFQTSSSSPQLKKMLQVLKNALLVSEIVAFSEGMHFLRTASHEMGFDLDLSQVARIWKGGCILRTTLLKRIQKALGQRELELLLESPEFFPEIQRSLESLRNAVIYGIQNGVPTPCLSATLTYIESFTSQLLPANLIQAQRDYFGAHTYRRIDREGIFHTSWEREES
ncbi:MAG: NADP-dependent phosphogluconate dehydrogenase [Atribacterota bacterium]